VLIFKLTYIYQWQPLLSFGYLKILHKPKFLLHCRICLISNCLFRLFIQACFSNPCTVFFTCVDKSNNYYCGIVTTHSDMFLWQHFLVMFVWVLLYLFQISGEMCSPQSALRDTMLRIAGVITGLLLQNEGFEMLDGLIFQCELMYR
jgi:hypothetical protein